MKLLFAALTLIVLVVPACAQYGGNNYRFENNRGAAGSSAQPFAPGNPNNPRYDPYASTYSNPYTDAYGTRDRRRPWD